MANMISEADVADSVTVVVEEAAVTVAVVEVSHLAVVAAVREADSAAVIAVVAAVAEASLLAVLLAVVDVVPHEVEPVAEGEVLVVERTYQSGFMWPWASS